MRKKHSKRQMQVTQERNPTSEESVVSSEKKAHLSSQVPAQFPQPVWRERPFWRHPLISYPGTLLLLAGSIWLTRALEDVIKLAYPSTVWVLALTLVALFWGLGPTILMVIVGVLALDIFVIPPLGDISLIVWPDAIQLLPFAVAGIAIAVITTQLERNRLQAHRANYDLGLYTSEMERVNAQLEEVNQKLETANTQLEKDSRTKDYFLSVASHELKTPVTSIRGQAQLFHRRLLKHKQTLIETKDVFPVLRKIDDLTLRLTTLINDLLDIGRIRRGQIQFHKERTDISQFCRLVVEEQRTLSSRKIAFHSPPEPVEVLVDQEQIRRVFSNLVSNAVKYSSEECPIEVRLKQHESFAQITVRDYGQGIAEENLSRIFEAFYRTDEARESGIAGIGLGLAIVKDIVELHQGRIYAQSEPGKGSTFFVELPLVANS